MVICAHGSVTFIASRMLAYDAVLRHKTIARFYHKYLCFEIVFSIVRLKSDMTD
jgi:hypothetical protein